MTLFLLVLVAFRTPSDKEIIDNVWNCSNIASVYFASITYA